jgi:hypothetical protein
MIETIGKTRLYLHMSNDVRFSDSGMICLKDRKIVICKKKRKTGIIAV